MKKENWSDVECQTEAINESLTVIEEAVAEASVRVGRVGKRLSQLLINIKNECENIKCNNNRIYSTCESDYCNACSDAPSGYYEDIFRLLPDGDKLSLSEMQSLVEHINNWKVENGYSTTNC